MTLDELLLSLGINLTSNIIHDALKSLFKKKTNPTIEECKVLLKSLISIENAQVYSQKIIEFLAQNGDIQISGSNVFARKEILIQSSNLTKVQIKDSSSISTDSNSINVGCFDEGSGRSIYSTIRKRNYLFCLEFLSIFCC